jgi:hypothetical protein
VLGSVGHGRRSFLFIAVASCLADWIACMKTPHKHAALIKAWADGAEIEKRWGNEWLKHAWCDAWHHDLEYRIKPTPKPDVVEWRYLVRSGGAPLAKPNIKLTFCGETGVLKEAEILI